MPTTVEQLSPTRVKIVIEVPFADLKPTIDKTYREIAGQVSIPGFRKGKVPPQVIDQRFGRGVVLQEAVNSALPEFYGKAIEDNKLVPLTQPEVDITKLEDGDIVEFTVEVDVRPDFELPDTAGVNVEIAAAAVSDEDIDQQVQTLRERFATMKDVDRAADEGDVVTLDLEATKDDKELTDAKAEGITYKVGAGGMLDGLDDALTGLKAGESTTFTSTLVGGPDKGTEADVAITVHKVAEQELPELDDDFAQLISEFDTVDEMREDLRSGLEQSLRMEQANAARDLLLEELLKRVDIPLPEKVLEEEVASRNAQIDQQLAQAGMTLADYLAESDAEEAETEEEFRAAIRERCELAMRSQFLLDRLVDERKPTITQQDFTQHIIRRAQQSGTSPEQEMQHMMEHDHMSEWMAEISRSKVLATLVAEAEVTDSNGEIVDMSALIDDEDDAETPDVNEGAEAVEDAEDQ